jgi:hypothetical protein
MNKNTQRKFKEPAALTRFQTLREKGTIQLLPQKRRKH